MYVDDIMINYTPLEFPDELEKQDSSDSKQMRYPPSTSRYQLLAGKE